MNRLLRRLRPERGLALPMALVVMTASGTLVVSVVQFTGASGRTAHVAKGRSSAEAFADAGIANALAVLNHASNNASNTALLGCNAAGTVCTPIVSTYNLGGTAGTATWSGWLDGSGGTSTWRITSIGQIPNPTGGAALQKTLTARVPLVTTTGTPNASVWNYVYSTKAPGSGCEVDIAGSNPIVDVPMYVTGDLCLTGSNAQIDERGEGQTPAPQAIDLRVGGKLVIAKSNNATVGNSSDYITSAGVVGGCTSTIGGVGHTCVTSDNYFVTTSQSFTAITAPTADHAAWFAATETINRTVGGTAAENDCDVVAGSPPNINPDTLRDADAGTINLTPASSYTCRKTADGTTGGTVIAEFSWNGSTTLTIKGATYVDGNASMTDDNATYNGLASIYANGSFTLNSSNGQMCANATCDFTTWNPNTEMLIVVANSIAINGSNNKWQGGLFCNPTSTANFGGGSSNVMIQGPVICGSFVVDSNTEFKPLPAITQLPVGAPVEPNVSVSPGAPVYGG